MSESRFERTEPSADGPLSGTLVVLWHGAGGDIHDATLSLAAERFAAAGASVARARFGYRRRGKKLPDRMPELTRDAAETIALLRAEAPFSRLILGGRSMGGRVASMLVAEGFEAHGLIFFSYPLHPEGQPEKLRDAHLSEIRCPMLFVSGDRDALCDLALLEPVLARLGDRATLELLPGATHSPRKKADLGRSAEVAVRWTIGLARST